MTDPPAEILRRLRPIPTSEGPPRTHPRDVVGVTPEGVRCRVEVMEAAAPVVLLFLSAACIGCQDLWEGLGQLQAGLGNAARLAVVTRSARESDDAVGSREGSRERGAKAEDATAVGELARHAAAGIDVVMSSEAFGDYRVTGPPFLVVVGPESVRTESVAWGVEQSLQIALRALQ